ncbi:MAG: hypothetical protein AVDCRST_MAG64-2265, partial [uncultured Phycisphaerae bacterium]
AQSNRDGDNPRCGGRGRVRRPGAAGPEARRSGKAGAPRRARPRRSRRPGRRAGAGAGEAGRAVLQRRRLLRALRQRPRQRLHRVAVQDAADQRHPQEPRPAGPRRRAGVHRHLPLSGPRRQDAPQLPGRHHGQPVARRPAEPTPRRARDGRDRERREARRDRPRRRAQAATAGGQGRAAGGRGVGVEHPDRREHPLGHARRPPRHPDRRPATARGTRAGAGRPRPGARAGQEAGHDQLPRRGRAARAGRVCRGNADLEDELPVDPRCGRGRRGAGR